MRTKAIALLALGFAACSSSEEVRSEFENNSPTPANGGGGGGGENAQLPPNATSSACRGIAIPDDQHFVADGLCASAVATDVGKLRQITFAKNGDLFGVTGDGTILRFRDLDGNGTYGGQEIVKWASVGGEGAANNVAIDEAHGFLYAGGPGIVRRFAYSSASDNGGTGEDIIVELPSTGAHVTHTVKLGGGFLYVHAGSASNVAAPTSPGYDNERAVIKRFPIDAAFPLKWSDGDVYARGLRNAVGYAFDDDGKLWATDNGIDDLRYDGKDIHETNPGEGIFAVDRGRTFGYPYCFSAFEVVKSDGTRAPAGTMLHVETADPALFTNPHDDAWCADNAVPAMSLLPAHSAPLDIALVTPSTTKLPAPYNFGAFVALHGSWNRTHPTGFKVVLVTFTEVGSTDSKVIFGGGKAGAPQDGPWGWMDKPENGTGESLVRPVGVAISPIDGSLYVSSDDAPVIGQKSAAIGKGALYRIAPRATFIVPD